MIRKTIKIILLLSFPICLLTSCEKDDSLATENPHWRLDNPHWCPTQVAPKGIVKCDTLSLKEGEKMQLSHTALLQSIAGLAADAVNQGTGDEMVWTDANVESDKEWYKECVSALSLEERGKYSVWELLDRYVKKGIVKGYILYDIDHSYQNVNINYSLNAATVFASIHKGVIIPVSLEEKVKSYGLNLLKDARQYNDVHNPLMQGLLNETKKYMNNNGIMQLSPLNAEMRDFAIAHRFFTMYENKGFATEAMRWLNPTSPTWGWGKSSDLENTSFSSIYSSFNIPTNNMPNLLVLQSVNNVAHQKVKVLDPKSIDWVEKKHYCSFVLNNGDDLQNVLRNYFHHTDYWKNPNLAKYPLGWALPISTISQLTPLAYKHMTDNQASNASLIEYSGGRVYVDVFGNIRGDREVSLRAFAKNINTNMKRNGVKVFKMRTQEQVDTKAAQQAYQIFAEELDEVVGMIAYQNSLPEDGNGKIMWVTNRKKEHIPVVSIKYLMSGSTINDKTPSEVPKKVIKEVTEANKLGEKTYGIVLSEQGSFYRKFGSLITTVKENDPGATRGVTPIHWAVDLIQKNKEIKIVSVEELLWRIRMEYYPEEVNKIIQ